MRKNRRNSGPRVSSSARRRGPAERQARRGGVVVFVTIGLIVLLGMAALTIDLGMLYVARTDLQKTADAAALAAAQELLDEDRLKGNPDMTEELTAARDSAVEYAERNPAMNQTITIDPNPGNSPSGEVVIGYLANPGNINESISFADPAAFNTVQVRVLKSSVRNGPLQHMFATIFGDATSDVAAQATATFKDGVTGYRIRDERQGNVELLPLALKINTWQALLAGGASAGDNYSYNPDTGAVTAGADGINELNLFPGAGTDQLPPGNFGTVDIGSSNNSTQVISRQIRYGITAEDLAYHGGELILGDDGVLPLNGDTGLSAAIKDDLEAIKGMPRAIPLFTSVAGPGNNAIFDVVGFAGIRIMYVKLTGSMSSKKVIIQPAYVVDDTAVTSSGSGNSYFVYQPVRLSR